MTLGEMYNPETMPLDLKLAHQAMDIANLYNRYGEVLAADSGTVITNSFNYINGYYDISEIEYAIVEANGELSILPKNRIVNVKDLNIFGTSDAHSRDRLGEGYTIVFAKSNEYNDVKCAY